MKLPSLSPVLTSALLGLAILTGGCAREDSAATPASSATARASFRLSDRARQAKAFLDDSAFEAAQKLFWNELGPKCDDAGLHCQYVRFLILSRDPAICGYIQTPINSDRDSYWWAMGPARDAARLAAETNPDCKTYLADLILESLALRLEQVFAEKRGCVGNAEIQYYPALGRTKRTDGTELSMLNLGWVAIELDSSAAQRWSQRYDHLLQHSIRLGKVATAMYLGNLTGDLKQQGKGPEDFRTANRALLAAIENYQSNGRDDWLKVAADPYPDCFRDEMLAMAGGEAVDPEFARLERKLAGFGVTVPRPTRETRKDIEMGTGAPPPGNP